MFTQWSGIGFQTKPFIDQSPINYSVIATDVVHTFTINRSAIDGFVRHVAVIAARNVAEDSKLGIFTVVVSSEPCVVCLYSYPSCSCPSQSRCYHIIAAQMLIGVIEEQPRRMVNSEEKQAKAPQQVVWPKLSAGSWRQHQDRCSRLPGQPGGQLIRRHQSALNWP